MSETITQAVKDKYGSVATSGLSTDHEGVKAVAEAFGYTPEELASIPAEANMGLSCGNPTATANLREGEMVVDLGSGGGLDVLLAARKVGPTGKAIGIDMTPEMIDLARRNAAKSGLANVEFHLADDRQAAAARRLGGLRDLQLRDQPGPRQARRLPGDRPSAEAGRSAGGQRHRPEAGVAARDRQRPDGVRRLHRRGDPDRGLSPAADRGGVRPRRGHRQRQRSERLRQGREPGGVLPAVTRCCGSADRRHGVLLAEASTFDALGAAFHARLTELLRRYNVNDYAASVRVFALKP